MTPKLYVVWAALSSGPSIRLVKAYTAESAERIHRELVPGDYELQVFPDDAEGLRALGEGIVNNLEALGAPEEPVTLALVVVP